MRQLATPSRSPVRWLMDSVRPRRMGAQSESFGRMGQLEVLLAASRSEIRRAQNLRYRVFYQELEAKAGPKGSLLRRDIDGFDLLCDHLLVVDHDRMRRTATGMKPEVVGTYRLLRQETAEANGGFFSSTEYAIDPLLRRHPEKRFLELGRSCVLKEYRNKRTVELLWQGLWAYICRHRVDALIGCASFEGTDPARHALPLAYLRHFCQAAPEWQVAALPGRGIPTDGIDPEAIDPKAAFRALPPLIKGYLRTGAKFSPEAVIDWHLCTTDMFVVMPIEELDARYVDYFSPSEAA